MEETTETTVKTEKQLKHKQYNDKYYNKNKDKIIAHLMRKVLCPCGCVQTYCNLSRHKKTQLHINRLKYPVKYKQYTEADLS